MKWHNSWGPRELCEFYFKFIWNYFWNYAQQNLKNLNFINGSAISPWQLQPWQQYLHENDKLVKSVLQVVYCCLLTCLAVKRIVALMPPVGVDAMVLSARTVIVSWSDSSSDSSSDDAAYTVRYRQRSLRARYRYVNVTTRTARLDELRPNSEYEICVKVSRGTRHSTWSMSVFVTTNEARTSRNFLISHFNSLISVHSPDVISSSLFFLLSHCPYLFTLSHSGLHLFLKSFLP